MVRRRSLSLPEQTSECQNQRQVCLSIDIPRNASFGPTGSNRATYPPPKQSLLREYRALVSQAEVKCLPVGPGLQKLIVRRSGYLKQR